MGSRPPCRGGPQPPATFFVRRGPFFEKVVDRSFPVGFPNPYTVSRGSVCSGVERRADSVGLKPRVPCLYGHRPPMRTLCPRDGAAVVLRGKCELRVPRTRWREFGRPLPMDPSPRERTPAYPPEAGTGRPPVPPVGTARCHPLRLACRAGHTTPPYVCPARRVGPPLRDDSDPRKLRAHATRTPRERRAGPVRSPGHGHQSSHRDGEERLPGRSPRRSYPQIRTGGFRCGPGSAKVGRAGSRPSRKVRWTSRSAP